MGTYIIYAAPKWLSLGRRIQVERKTPHRLRDIQTRPIERGMDGDSEGDEIGYLQGLSRRKGGRKEGGRKELGLILILGVGEVDGPLGGRTNAAAESRGYCSAKEKKSQTTPSVTSKRGRLSDDGTRMAIQKEIPRARKNECNCRWPWLKVADAKVDREGGRVTVLSREIGVLLEAARIGPRLAGSQAGGPEDQGVRGWEMVGV
ncbi:hypothetical protein B0H16DRAFT_1702794 [Mycena metata]|uniref:Uncharacterized protein n=1 Tax=Mycena metata TaxID=1033252 RepID=A0AAD7MDW5_9AGAR|nr:hypothetical protein B0H16DRAFT_1702794 [Mycena metata]